MDPIASDATPHPTSRAPSRARRIVLAVVLVLFGLAGLARLNPFCLLEPDSADYLFTSRAIATLDGYREIDHPDRPLHSFRPPGLPLLLVPISWVRAYDVVTAKAMLLAVTLCMLGLTYLLARRVRRDASVWAVLLLVASSPYSLLHATEVVTEPPFIAAALGFLLLIPRENRRAGWRDLVPATLLLAFIPVLRTIGVALVGAVALWALTARARLRWLGCAVAATLPTLLWTWRNSRAGGPTYLGSVLSDLSQNGLAGVSADAARAGAGYLARLADLLLPGVRPGQPLYERVLLEPASDLRGLWGLALPVAALIVVLALIGMWQRRAREGGPALAYGLLFVGMLAIYPPQHERLTWPLVPLVWVYAPLGLEWVTGRLRSTSPRALRALRASAFGVAVALVVWQGWACGAMVGTNLQWARSGDRFYAEQYPPIYYSDWQAAGRWIEANSNARERVLTRHSDTGFGARRQQDSLRFEELSPIDWRQRVVAFGARYLVVPTAEFGALFRWEAMRGDPTYTYRVAHESRGVAVLEIDANRTGTIRAGNPRLERQIAACRDAIRRHPRRLAPRRRVAELLTAQGRGEQAVALLLEARDELGDSAELHVSLGRAMLELERFDEARESFLTARSLPEAEHLRNRIESGLRRARSGATDDDARELAERARWQLAVFDLDGAERSLEEAAALAPQDPVVRFARGEWHQRLGEREAALPHLTAAAREGFRPAALKLELLRLQQAVAHGPARDDPGAWYRLAELLGGDGQAGRALDLLEEAARRFPDSAPIRLRLADLWLFYGRPERAGPLYREVIGARPELEAARRGLERVSRFADASY